MSTTITAPITLTPVAITAPVTMAVVDIQAPITLGGRSAYQSYLATTGDDPVLSEAEWSASREVVPPSDPVIGAADITDATALGRSLLTAETASVALTELGLSPLPEPLATLLDLGPRVWLNAQSGVFQDSAATTPATTAGDPVGAWVDATGNARNAVQSTSTKRPLLGIHPNGLKYIYSDGVDDCLMLGSAFAAATLAERTFIAVGRGITNTNSWFELYFTGANRGAVRFNNTSIDFYDSSSVQSGITHNFDGGGWMCFSVRLSNTGVTITRNDMEISHTAFKSVTSTIASTAGLFGRQLNASSSDQFARAELMQFAGWNRALSDLELRAAIRYLMGLSGLTF